MSYGSGAEQPAPSSTSQHPERGRRVALDGIRALAVLFVFAYHTGYNAGPAFLGVNIFFVLSGYLITGLLLEEVSATGAIHLTPFYARRGLRLFPALLCAIVLAIVCAATTRLESTGTLIGESAGALFYVEDIVRSANAHIFWLSHTWSLGVEEQFYLIWPLVLIAVAKSGRVRENIARILVGLTVVSVLAVLILGGTATAYSPLGCAFQLVAGALAAVYKPRVGRWWPPLAIVAAYALLWIIGADPRYRLLYFGPMQLFTLASVAAILWADQHRPWLLANRPVVWLGRRSYGFYLYHVPILILLQQHVQRHSEQAGLGFVLSLAAAGLSYQFVEQPFLTLKDRFEVLAPDGGAVVGSPPVEAATMVAPGS